MAKSKVEIVETIKKEGVQFVQLWFTDVLGFLKGLTISSSEVERAFQHGLAFDGSSIEGFARVEESDMVIKPDVNTFAILPWEIQGGRAARMFCDVFTPKGKPVEFDPRRVLRRVLKNIEKMGYTAYVGCELENFYFKTNEHAELLDQGSYFDLIPTALAEQVRGATIAALKKLGISVEYSHHEVSPSQHEVDLRYTDALTMADSVITYRFVARQVARENGIHCSFMPKPVFGINGSGMHTHISLFQGSKNAFFSAKDKMNLSVVCRYFIAGLLKYAPEITAVTNQWVNSYKRLVPGYEAPIYISWARMNRSALIRVPAFSKERPEAARIEFRSPDPACNPYLAFAVIFAAGLKGIEDKLSLGPPTPDNIYRMTEDERQKAGITSLPKDLSEAIQLAEKSQLVRNTFGEELFRFFLRNKKQEWDEYKAQVTEFEIKRYLPIL
ncbi:MAG: glutamine synthetase family protein [candidate division WOR-3 bacterium]